MKKTMLFVSLIWSSMFFVQADDRPVADKETIEELKSYCSELASEDNISEAELTGYLLKCVNEELEDYGYQPIKDF